MRLNHDSFLHVVSNAPLIAIDLLLERSDGAVLLGLRKNRPAQGAWFVPGGRIYKGESMQVALARIVADELGTQLPGAWTFFGAYEHFYADNFAGVEHIDTHYVTLAHHLRTQTPLTLQPDLQHSSLQWFSVPQLINDSQVHRYTKAYFEGWPGYSA